MCGIAGLVTRLPLAQASIQPMREGLRARLHHRGPDAFGVHAHARGLYANARLAIVDRAARLHGGTVRLMPREGGGLVARVELRLPPQPPATALPA